MPQSPTPLMDYLQRYAQSGAVRYHMPGHKGRKLPVPFPAAWDITEIEGSDNLHNPRGIIAQSQALLAQAAGAAHSFYLVGGSTAGIQAMILFCAREGDKLLIERNCHKSVISALALSGAQPVYLWAQTDAATGLPGCLTPRQVQEAVRAHPDAKALLITSPNYYGCAADLPAIAQILHRAGMLLLVDEAHGAHLPYAPQGAGFAAGAAGAADLWVQSAHKTLPAPTQSAMLHTRSKRDVPRLQRLLAMLQTSSPSYLLMAGLEYARAWMQQHGAQGLLCCQKGMDGIREMLNGEDGGIRAIGREIVGRGGIAALDPTRLVIDVSQNGLTGCQAEGWLREHHGIWAEMSDMRHVVLLGAAADGADMVEGLRAALKELSGWKQGMLTHPLSNMDSLPVPKAALDVRSVMLGNVRRVPLAQAEGEVFAAAVGLYPPGIAMLCPGEVAGAAHICALETAARRGAQLFGVQDGLVDIVSR